MNKKDYKSDSISSADANKDRSYFQRFLFDPLKYQKYFDTNTEEIKRKLVDALWPFSPENQHHLVLNDCESVKDYSQQQSSRRSQEELYGPLWIAVTLIIEFCILSHLIGALKLQSVISSS